MGITIVLDMDGTIADLDNVPCWIERLEMEDSTAYSAAKPMCDMSQLSNIIKIFRECGGRVVVATHAAIGSSIRFEHQIYRAKKEWLEKYDIEYDKLTLKPYGTNKSQMSNGFYSTVNILIDDNPTNREVFVLDRDKNYAVNPSSINIVKFIKECAAMLLTNKRL